MKKEHDKIVSLAKAKLNTIAVYGIYDSYISYGVFVLVNNILREYGDTKEAIKILKTSTVHQKL